MTPAPLLWFRDPAPRPGDEQMRRDRNHLRRADPTPLLRFYAWAPSAVSLGYHQDPGVVDGAALAADGIDLVVRPTGGAAVLHADELTYMLVARRDGPFGSTLAEVYDVVAGALVAALNRHGIPALRGGGGRPGDAACFSAAGGHEVTVEGRKLVGSACRLTRSAFLVHGSILTGPGHLRLPDYLTGLDDVGRSRLRSRLTARTVDLGACGMAAESLEDLCVSVADALGERSGGARRGAPPDDTD